MRYPDSMVRWLVRVLQFLRGYTELVYVSVGLMVWEYLTKTHLSASTQWSLYGGAFVGLSFWNWNKAVDLAEHAGSAPAAKPAPEPRAFAEHPEDLIAQLGNPKLLTSMQLVSYLEKWILIKGTVEIAGGSNLTVILERGQRVSLAFADDRPVEALRRGDSLTAVCQIRPSHAQPWYSLENCEVVRTVAALARAS